MLGKRWYAVAAMFVALQFVAIGQFAAMYGFDEWPPFTKYLAASGACFGMAAMGLAVFRIRSMPDDPLQHLKQYDWTNVKQFGLVMVLVWLQFVVLTWAKVMIPAVTLMLADPILAEWDVAIFGVDAWRVLPGPNAAFIWAYALWPAAVFIALAVTFFKGRETALLAFFLTVGLLGTFGQYLMPSGGPIFFERLGYGDRYAGLPVPGPVRDISAYLWQAYTTKSTAFGGGISAFPSIHVATATWMFLALRHWSTALFLGLILFGSVALGWHYAVDGIAGIIGAIGCYLVARKIMDAPAEISRVQAVS